MKRLRLFVMTLGIALCVPLTAYAKLPYYNEGGLLIMGNTAYSISYLSTLGSNDLKSINDRITGNKGNVYYCFNNSNNEFIYNTDYLNSLDWKNLNQNLSLSESSVNNRNSITYYGLNSPNGQMYIYDSSTSQYQPQSFSAAANVRTDNIGNLRMLYVLINSSDIKGLNGQVPVYFKLEHNPNVVPLGSRTSCLLNSDGHELVYILDANKNTIATGTLTVSSTNGNTILQYFNLVPFVPSISGLGTGNMNNNGFVAYEGNWIYYSNTADGGKLYKVQDNGMDNQQISVDEAHYINVVGNVVYYSNYTEGGKIYRVNTDGTQRTKVCDDMASYLVASESTLYYSNHSDGGKLYKVDMSQCGGSGTKIRSDVNDDVAYLAVDGNTIYYSNYSDGRNIYSINKDGLCRTQLTDYGAMFIQSYNDCLYYINYSDDKIYMMKKDGSQNTKICDNKATSMNFTFPYIYYSNYSDGGKIYRVNYDGSNGAGPLVKDSAEFINVISSGNIYYSKSGKLYNAVQSDSNTWTSSNITKPVMSDKISKLNNLTAIVPSNEAAIAYPLPDRVPAIMSSGVMKDLVVSWDKEKYTQKGSTYVYSGIVLGYGNKVTLTLTVAASDAIDPNNVTITNNGGPNDTIQVKGLKSLDTVYVYSSSTVPNPFASGQVSAGNTTVTINTTLDNSINSVWLTVRSTQGTSSITPTESKRVEVQYPSETPMDNSVGTQITNNSGANDKVVVTGLTPGDVVNLYKNKDDVATITNGTMKSSSNSVTFNSLDLGPSEGSKDSLWIGIKRGTMSESQRKSWLIPESDNVAKVKKTQTDIKNILSKALTDSNSINAGGDICADIILPSTDTINNNGVLIKWSVSNESGLATLINSAVKITRPLYNSGKNLNVIFKATPYLDDYPLSGSAELSVDTKNIAETSPQEIVDYDAANATISYYTGDSSTSVTNDMTVLTKGQYNSTLTWTAYASNPFGSDGSLNAATAKSSYFVIDNNTGNVKVTRPPHGAGDQNAYLVAVATFKDKDGNSYSSNSQAMKVTIKELSGAYEDLDTAINSINNTYEITGITSNPYTFILSHITGTLTSGINAQWLSNNPNIIFINKDINNNQDGTATVVAPTYSDGNTTAMLTLTLTKDSETKQKNIMVTIDCLPPTDLEAVQATDNKLSYYLLINNQSTDKDHLNGDLYLPATATEIGVLGLTKPVSITWSSSNDAVTVVGETGKFNSSTTQTQVTLTATISCGTEKYIKNFVFTIAKP
jgi:hypothetical protein